jgi:hypothetical protein
MADSIWVKPNEDEIKNNLVALWDQDPAHFEVNPKWAEEEGGPGGAFIAGNKRKPDAVYQVANTYGVTLALKAGRIVRAEPPAIPTPSLEQLTATPAGDAKPATDDPAKIELPQGQSEKGAEGGSETGGDAAADAKKTTKKG